MSRTNIRRIAVALSLGGVLLVSRPAVSGGLLWDAGVGCGYVCLILFVCLYMFPVRGDGLPHARLMGLTQHRSIGWWVLAAAIAHAVVLLVAEPQSARYLLPSAPVFMWCGVVALGAVIASVVTGLSVRAQMRRLAGKQPAAARSRAGGSRLESSRAPGAAGAMDTRRAPSAAGALDSRRAPGAAGALETRHAAAAASESRATAHLVLAALVGLTACAHAIGSAQLLGGALKTAVVLLLLCLPLGWYALRRRSTPRGSGGAGGGRGGTNGSHERLRARPASQLVRPAGEPARPAGQLARPASHLAAVGIIALLPTSTSKQLLLEPVVRPAAIPVSFPHDSHTSVSCVTCHHNYVDHTGTTACIECHRSARTDLVHSSESTFHAFCRGCHTQLALDWELNPASHRQAHPALDGEAHAALAGQAGHGPTRSCSGCHQGMRSSNL